MQALRAAPPDRLSADQADMLRELADTLLFATRFDGEVRGALTSARVLLLALPGPLDSWTDELALAIATCAPLRDALPSMPEPLNVR
jgi:hypothetical protein